MQPSCVVQKSALLLLNTLDRAFEKEHHHSFTLHVNQIKENSNVGQISIQSTTCVSLETFVGILKHYGYSLKEAMTLELSLQIPQTTAVEHVRLFFKELQESIGNNTNCLFEFNITQEKTCTMMVTFK